MRPCNTGAPFCYCRLWRTCSNTTEEATFGIAHVEPRRSKCFIWKWTSVTNLCVCVCVCVVVFAVLTCVYVCVCERERERDWVDIPTSWRLIRRWPGASPLRHAVQRAERNNQPVIRAPFAGNIMRLRGVAPVRCCRCCGKTHHKLPTKPPRVTPHRLSLSLSLSMICG